MTDEYKLGEYRRLLTKLGYNQKDINFSANNNWVKIKEMCEWSLQKISNGNYKSFTTASSKMELRTKQSDCQVLNLIALQVTKLN